jgi:hypothetical protein
MLLPPCEPVRTEGIAFRQALALVFNYRETPVLPQWGGATLGT